MQDYLPGQGRVVAPVVQGSNHGTESRTHLGQAESDFEL